MLLSSVILRVFLVHTCERNVQIRQFGSFFQLYKSTAYVHTLWKLAELSKEGVRADTELMVRVGQTGAIVNTWEVTYVHNHRTR